MLKETEDVWKESDVFFNCIGTTRQKGRRSKAVCGCRIRYFQNGCNHGFEANIPHASVISASGANHKAWAVDWIHPLLYQNNRPKRTNGDYGKQI